MKNKDNAPIRVLLIAPYEGLIHVFEDAIYKRSNFLLTSYECDTINAPSLIKKLDLTKYDIIISRGYTAQMIRQACGRQVLNVGISIYDSLRTLQLAKNYNGKIAIVGFQSIVHYAIILKDILRYNVDIFAINSIDELREKLIELKSRNYNMIIGDVITTTIAKEIGLQNIVITTSRESVEECLDNAQEIYSVKTLSEQQILFFKSVLNNIREKVVVYSENNTCIFSTESIPEEVDKFLLSSVPHVIEGGSLTSVRTLRKIKYHIFGKKMIVYGQTYVVFSFRMISEINQTSNFIHYYDLMNAPAVSQKFLFSSTPAMQNILDSLKNFQFLSRPIVICGAKGTGKNQFVYYFNQVRQQKKTPLVIIDCNFVSTNEWKKLINDTNSCIYEKNFVIYFKDVHKLSTEQQADILTLIKNINLHKKNQLIFSYVPEESADFDKSLLKDEIQNNLQAVTFRIPPLNERKQDLQNIITLYLNEFNQQYSKQIIELTPEAMKYIMNYSWPGNLNELHNVMQQLIFSATSSVITIDNVKTVLRNMNNDHPSKDTMLNLDGTLEEIENQIIRKVLEEEHGNQTKAAKRLGIGRSTLCRHLS